MNRKDLLPIEIKLKVPNHREYWERMDWCKENIGKQMGSDDLDPPGRWFQYFDFGVPEDDHVFCFDNEEIASLFAMRFIMGFTKE